MKLTSEYFGEANGQTVRQYLLDNGAMEVGIINYGGIITSIKVPDRAGEPADVVLGQETLEGYLNRSRYFGALIGRYGNRIARGQFSLNGTTYNLAQNNGRNHLHGGLKGFDKVVWDAQEVQETGEVGLQLTYSSRDGEESYPGELNVRVRYLLTEAHELRVEYSATTDQDTIVNLTNHSYFNLAAAGTILDHELTIDADAFTPVHEDLIPTGEIRPVANTPMDFNRATSIGARINGDYEQLLKAGGYDHNFVLRTNGGPLKRAARLLEPRSGRVMEVFTTQPGMQFYSGNFLDGSIVGKAGARYGKNCACCFETQHFPDSPNHPNFPSTVLRPREQYQQVTVFKFSVE